MAGVAEAVAGLEVAPLNVIVFSTHFHKQGREAFEQSSTKQITLRFSLTITQRQVDRLQPILLPYCLMRRMKLRD